nr:MAG TPA: hypothetical protein [Caudoviricetes sp.]
MALIIRFRPVMRCSGRFVRLYGYLFACARFCAVRAKHEATTPGGLFSIFPPPSVTRKFSKKSARNPATFSSTL